MLLIYMEWLSACNTFCYISLNMSSHTTYYIFSHDLPKWSFPLILDAQLMVAQEVHRKTGYSLFEEEELLRSVSLNKILLIIIL